MASISPRGGRAAGQARRGEHGDERHAEIREPGGDVTCVSFVLDAASELFCIHEFRSPLAVVWHLRSPFNESMRSSCFQGGGWPRGNDPWKRRFGGPNAHKHLTQNISDARARVRISLFHISVWTSGRTCRKEIPSPP